jgi:hypothetical protein
MATHPEAGEEKGARPRRWRRVPRADLGPSPVDGFFKEAARRPSSTPSSGRCAKLVEETVPYASSSIKWGMPYYASAET